MTSPLRWQIKKAARMGVALGSFVSGQVPPKNSMLRRVQVRALTYHRFGTEARDPFCIEPDAFEKQMRYLAQTGLAVSLADLQRFVSGNGALPPGAVVVTVDDGFRSLYTKALPILRHYGIPAVAFVTAGLIESSDGARMQSKPEPYLSWDDLERLTNAGVAIGSHAWTHRSLGPMSVAEAEEEAVLSRRTLESNLGVPVSAFAYPFGTRADFNARTADVLMRTGYHCAFTSQHGAIYPGMDPFVLPRVKVESGEQLWLFQMMLRGGLDAWALIDRTLWRVQASDRGR